MSGAGTGRLGGISMRGNSSANRTLFSIKSSERLLMRSHRVTGAFASDKKSHMAPQGESSSMLR